QTTIIIGVALNGSSQTSLKSGFRIMSDSLIVFQPAIDEPSNIKPSSSASSSRSLPTIVRCCHLPLGSVKRRSTHSISSSLIRFTISDALAILVLPCWSLPVRGWLGTCLLLPMREGESSSNRVFVLLARADTQGGFDRRNEDFSVADPSGLRGGCDRFDDGLGLCIGDHHFKPDLGQEIDDILGTAIEFGMALLAAKPLGFGNRDARHPDLVERLLDLVQLERLDDG